MLSGFFCFWCATYEYKRSSFAALQLSVFRYLHLEFDCDFYELENVSFLGGSTIDSVPSHAAD
jgi:hypothetical protein